MSHLTFLSGRKASNYLRLTAYQNLLQFQTPSLSFTLVGNCTAIELAFLESPFQSTTYMSHVDNYFSSFMSKIWGTKFDVSPIDCVSQICKQLLNFGCIWSGLALHLWRRLHLIDSHGPQTIGSLIRINRRWGTGAGVKGWHSRQGTCRPLKNEYSLAASNSLFLSIPFILKE